jgi:hypothetical protein
MNQAELEAKLEQGRVWLAQQMEQFEKTGTRHKLYDQQLDKFCEFWADWWDIKTKGRLF